MNEKTINPNNLRQSRWQIETQLKKLVRCVKSLKLYQQAFIQTQALKMAAVVSVGLA